MQIGLSLCRLKFCVNLQTWSNLTCRLHTTLQTVAAMKSTEIDETDVKNLNGLLSSEQIEEFHRRGVLVVRNFLNGDEVAEARKGKLFKLLCYLSAL